MNQDQISYMVYWHYDNTPYSREFFDMGEALVFMEHLRKSGRSHVTLSSENTNQVGKMGVDSVENGVLPDGLEYIYKTGRDRGRESK